MTQILKPLHRGIAWPQKTEAVNPRIQNQAAPGFFFECSAVVSDSDSQAATGSASGSDGACYTSRIQVASACSSQPECFQLAGGSWLNEFVMSALCVANRVAAVVVVAWVVVTTGLTHLSLISEAGSLTHSLKFAAAHKSHWRLEQLCRWH
jgi:hypothetical protein